MNPRAHRHPSPAPPPRGATLTEFVVVAPILLFLLLNLIQYGLLYHAKSQLNYATFEAARAGTVKNADPAYIRAAFTRAMTGYHGGGTTTGELAASHARALAESAFARIEILSPLKESFDDYHSPELAERLKTSGRVIPAANLTFIRCPVDRPGCDSNPASNQSGQTLADANLLKLRITYGIPERKQIPLAGPFMARALAFLHAGDTDAFRAGLVAAGRIPVVTHIVMRMQSPAIENDNPSNPGPGNGGDPEDPGPGPADPVLPPCPPTDPTCLPDPPRPDPPEPPCDELRDPTCAKPPPCPGDDATSPSNPSTPTPETRP